MQRIENAEALVSEVVRTHPAPKPMEERVLVPVKEWMPGLMLHVAFVTRFNDELEARA
jgi:hypothetical protein